MKVSQGSREMGGMSLGRGAEVRLETQKETYAGDPAQCSRVDDSLDDPGISNAWDFSGARGVSGGGLRRGA